MIPLRLTLACTLTIWAAAASAQIVECTDAKGAKLYTQQCPPGTVKEREVVKGGQYVPQDTSSSPQKSLDVQAAEFRKRQMEREEAEAKTAKEQAEAADAERNCNDARAQLKAIEDGQRIGKFDPDTGERAILGDDERAAEIERARNTVEQWCKQ